MLNRDGLPLTTGTLPSWRLPLPDLRRCNACLDSAPVLYLYGDGAEWWYLCARCDPIRWEYGVVPFNGSHTGEEGERGMGD